MEYNSLLLDQWQWLEECLADNKNTLYGITYNFASISSMQMYQKMVPLISYQDIEKYVDSISRGEKDILFSGSAVAFEITGGSTGGSKLIPYTQKSFRDFQRAILPYLESTFLKFEINPENVYWSISPATRTTEKTKSGVIIGVSDSDYLGLDENNESIIPAWVSQLDNINSWKLATLYWLISAKNLKFISIWSPTFLLVLLESLDEYEVELREIFKNGGEISGHKVSSDIGTLERFLNYCKSKNSEVLWSNLRLISLWQDGTSATYAKKLKKMFPTVHFESKGLLSTEGIVSIPDKGIPVLSANSGFYEFITIDNEVLFSHQLKNAEEYEVVLTTNGGLYRYCTGDIVLCEGYRDEKPILRFRYRKGILSDMVGEKLTESFVSTVLEDIPGFAMIVPHTDSLEYSLVVENNSEISKDIIEKKLFKNPQYRYAREFGQLKELKIIEIQNPLKVYIDKMVSEGKRIGDIKIPSLSKNDRWIR